VLLGLHVFDVTTHQQAPTHEGSQDGATQINLHLRHSGGIDSTGRLKVESQREGFGIDLTLHTHRDFLKHPSTAHTRNDTAIRTQLSMLVT